MAEQSHHDDRGRFDFAPGGNQRVAASGPRPPKTPPTPAKPAPAPAPGPNPVVPPGKTIRNKDLAGKNHPVTGIPFDKDGFPDFSGVAQKTVKVPLTGKYQQDFAAANKAAGYSEIPQGMTWHHHQDGVTLQLVQRELHAKTGHTGSIGVGNTPGKKNMEATECL